MMTRDDEFGRRQAGFGRSADESKADQGQSSEADDSGAEPRGRRRHRHHRHRQGGGRKERVLHTRISEQLSEDIRRLADDLRVPASNLVRNVLEEVFTMVESVSEDVGELFEDVLDEASEARDRVRRRVSRRRSGAGDAGRGARREPSGRADEDFEQELRRDEASESTGSGASRGPEAESTVRPEAPAEQRDRPVFPDVIGWQALVLNHDRNCASCGVALRRGSHACIGLGAHGLTAATLCRACAGIRD